MQTLILWIIAAAIALGQWTTDWETQYVPNVVPAYKKATRFFVDSLYRAYVPGKYVSAVAFAGRDTCFLATAFFPDRLGGILRSTDYGRHWDSVLLVDRRGEEARFIDLEWDGSGRIYGVFRRLYQGDPDPTAYSSQTILWWSDDLGQQWDTLDLNSVIGGGWEVHGFDLEMLDSASGALTAVISRYDSAQGERVYSPVILYTEDRWRRVDTAPGIGWGVSKIKILGKGIWVVQNYANIGWTTDYGAHWSVMNIDTIAKQQWGWSPTQLNVMDMDAVSLDRWYVCANYYPTGGYVVAKDVIIEIRDRGKAVRRLLDTLPLVVPWGRMRDVAFTGAFYQIDFLDTLRGIAVGSSNKIWMTTDGGKHWKQQAVDLIPGAEARVDLLFGSVFRSCRYGDTDRIIVGGIEYAVIYRPGQLLRRPWVWGQHRVVYDTVENYGPMWRWGIRTKTVKEVPYWLRWSPVEGAIRYRVVMYDDSSESDLAKKPPERVLDTVVSDTAIGLWVRPNKDQVVVYLRAEGADGKVSNWWQLLWKSWASVVGAQEAELQTHGRMVYPNPTRGRFWIVYPKEGRWSVEVRTVMGQVVWQRPAEWKERGEREEVDLRGVSNGTYYVRLQHRWWKVTVPVVVVR